ncbi:hypothetical protein COY27_05825 [Candidatus Woesearchaeota archaeon CG_4_10_14_0_2_um_filter_33_13]|nr:MAG: hypothetical protein COY27_05825 [Candidatus Woesearchaeota archaeon CG_4_10_14_0_2_um_filter_33_13]
MRHLKRGLHLTLNAIKQHKSLFILMVILQLILLFSVTYISINYQIKIINNAQQIMEPLQSANFNVTSIQAGQPFTTEILEVYQGYKSMIKYIWQLIFWLSSLFILFNGALWIISQRMLGYKNWKGQILKFLTTSIILIVPFFLAAYYLLKLFLGMELAAEIFSIILQVVIWAFFVLYFFIITAYAFIDAKSWKEFVKSIYKVGIRRIYFTLIVTLINLVLIFLGLLLIYYTANEETLLPLMVLAALLFVVVILLTRIFWIACLKEINSEKNIP